MAVRKPTDLTVRAWWHALRDAAKSFQEKSLSDAAAALTYYSVLSIFPGLIVLVSLLGVVGSQESVDGLLRIAEDLGSASAVDTLRDPIENIVNNSGGAGARADHRHRGGALVGVGLHRRLHPRSEPDLRGRGRPAVLEAAAAAAR